MSWQYDQRPGGTPPRQETAKETPPRPSEAAPTSPQQASDGAWLPVPYPQPLFACPNTGCARMLHNAYAGENGEFSAIARYFYQSVTLQSTAPEASRLLHQIALVEMKHLQMLGQCIAGLGGSPTFAGSRGGAAVWWSGAWVPRGGDLKLQLLQDIESEQAAVRAYRQLTGQIPLSDLQALLCRIVMDEEHHIELFSQLLRRHCGCR